MKYLTLIILFLLYSCNDVSKTKLDDNLNESYEYSDTLPLPIDTIKLLKAIDMKLGMSIMSQSDSMKYFDTIIVYDLMYACDCPSWFPSGENYDSLTNYGIKDTISVYIEPANSQLYIDPYTRALGNVFKFYGKITNYNGLPKFNDFMKKDPPKGKVFTYYGYERVLPHKIYGPYVYKKTYNGNTEVSILTLSKKHVLEGHSIFE